MSNNIILNTDSYKTSHFEILPENTTRLYAYGEARGGAFPETVMFGLQPFLMDWLSKPITQENIDEAEEFTKEHGVPFNKDGWEYILKEYNGFLPVRIKAVPEGTVVPVSNVLYTIENTDDKCAWLTSYLETAVLRAVWYGTTVATQSREMVKVITESLKKSGDISSACFKLCNFGSRGVSSYESDGIASAAHLITSKGTDSMTGIQFARKYYNTKSMLGFSIPATEHSISTSYGPDKEYEYFKTALQKWGKTGALFATVGDTYDVYNAAIIVGSLKDELIASGATWVFRPDSGDPVAVTENIIKILDKSFGHTLNEKGYKVLPSCIRIIQGDGINFDMLQKIIDNLLSCGYSIDNIAFGSGGGLLQQVNRDTCRMAQKASWVLIDGVEHSICKMPITDMHKLSKRGRVTLVTNGKEFKSVLEKDVKEKGWSDKPFYEALVVVYENGKLYNMSTFEQVQERAKI
jgi:nicotinamide phosphoribosyltransferase